MKPRTPFPPGLCTFEPSRDQVSSLIEQAHKHPLGIDFLQTGALDAVAATFQVHAFTVERARDTVETQKQTLVQSRLSWSPTKN